MKDVKQEKNMWSKIPVFHQLDIWELPKPATFTLDNGIPVYYIHNPDLEFFRVDVVFRAGRIFEDVQLTSKAVSELLKEGSYACDSDELDETIDRYGASLSIKAGMDHSRITLMGLTRFLPELLPIISRLLDEPHFANNDIETFQRRNKELLRMDLSNAEVVAYRSLTEKIFGGTHPYGYNSSNEKYDALSREKISAHFKKCYRKENAQIFICTNMQTYVRQLLNRTFGQAFFLEVEPNAYLKRPLLKSEKPSSTYVEMCLDHPHQSAIMLGRQTGKRSHSDFHALHMLNTVLGGYFGSRLMMNIREKRGYTYHISSSLDAMMCGGFFTIATEVSHTYRERVIDEIYREIADLQQSPIPHKELTMVRNYLLGHSLNSLDGSFNILDLIRIYISQTGSIEAFNELMRRIMEISANEIMHIARQYLKKEDLITIVVS